MSLVTFGSDMGVLLTFFSKARRYTIRCRSLHLSIQERVKRRHEILKTFDVYHCKMCLALDVLTFKCTDNKKKK